MSCEPAVAAPPLSSDLTMAPGMSILQSVWHQEVLSSVRRKLVRH